MNETPHGNCCEAMVAYALMAVVLAAVLIAGSIWPHEIFIGCR